TFLGGSSTDHGLGIAVDGAGNSYVTGMTFSSNFPTAGALQSGNNGDYDVFITKLNAAGNRVYSTYLGGSGDDRGFGIAIDSAGQAYITGYTASAAFPTRNAAQATIGGGIDAFV